jgi:hypothetical protein
MFHPPLDNNNPTYSIGGCVQGFSLHKGILQKTALNAATSAGLSAVGASDYVGPEGLEPPTNGL